MELVNFLLNARLNVVELDELFGRLLFAKEIFDWNSEAVQQDNDLSIEESLTEGRTPHDVETQVIGWKLHLAVSELHQTLRRKAILILHNQHSLCPSKPDLHCTYRSVLPLCSYELRQIWMKESAPVRKAEAVPFDVRDANLDLSLLQLADKLGS